MTAQRDRNLSPADVLATAMLIAMFALVVAACWWLLPSQPAPKPADEPQGWDEIPVCLDTCPIVRGV